MTKLQSLPQKNGTLALVLPWPPSVNRYCAGGVTCCVTCLRVTGCHDGVRPLQGKFVF